MPSNVKAGYVIRRILRRAIRYGYTFLGMKEPFIFEGGKAKRNFLSENTYDTGVPFNVNVSPHGEMCYSKVIPKWICFASLKTPWDNRGSTRICDNN